MALRTVLKYAAIAVGLLILVSVAISVVSAIVGLVWTAIVALATLLVLAGIGYAAVKGFLWYRGRGGSEVQSVTDTESKDPVDRLVERYVDGDLTETELERRLDRVLGGPDRDEIDRELERTKERS